MEDVTEIVLNVKRLIVRSSAEEPKTMKVSAKKIGPGNGRRYCS